MEKYNDRRITLAQLQSFAIPKLADAMYLSKEIIGIKRLDVNGQEVAQCGIRFPPLKWLAENFGKNSISLSAPVAVQDRLAVVVKAPIRNRRGDVVGTDLVSIDLCFLKAIVSKDTQLSDKSDIILGYVCGNQFFNVFPLEKENQPDCEIRILEKSLTVFVQRAIAGEKGLGRLKQMTLAYHSIPIPRWGLVIVQDKKDLYAGLNFKLLELCLISVLMFLASLLGFWFLMRPLTGRLLIHSDELTAEIQKKTDHLEREIASRKKSESRLTYANTRLQQMENLVVSGPIVVFQWKNEPGWPVEYVSSNVKSVLGYEINELLDKNFLYEQIIHPDDFEQVREEVLLLEKAGSDSFSHKPYRIFTKEKKIVWVLDYTLGIRDESHALVSAIGYLINITDRMNIEKELQTSERFLNVVFNSIQDGISVLDPQLTIVNTNKAMKNMYPHALALEGKKCFEAYRCRTAPCDPCPSVSCLTSKKLEMDYVPLKRPGQPDGTLELYAFPMMDENGMATGVVEYTRDVTKTRQIEKLLVIQRDLGLQLGNTASLQQALDACLESVLKMDGVHSAGIYLVDSGDGGIRLAAHKDLPAWFVELSSYYDGNSPQVRLIMKGKSIFSSYEAMLSRMGLTEKEIRTRNASGMRILGVIPACHENKVVAVLNASSSQGDSFPEFTRYALESIASQIAGVLVKIRSADALKASERNLKDLFENLDDFLFVLDTAGRIVAFNPVVRNRLGYSENQLYAMNVLNLHPPDRREEAKLIIEEMLAGKIKHCPIPLLTQQGQQIPVETIVTIGIWDNKPAVFGISRDITQIKKSEEMTKSALKEKETLLREIHHRVKNNMQVISSLLSLQANKTDDPATVKALSQAESRVHSMSLVHEVLHQSENISNIDFQTYLEKLIHYLNRMFVQETSIEVDIQAENIVLPMEQVIACGLIVTELVTNALKYAFREGKGGKISITVLQVDKNQYRMQVSDNGIGFPEYFNWEHASTLGMRLVRELVQGQLEGRLNLIENRGICWDIMWTTD
jgi:PAS domain S-box-containing protein